MRGNEVHADAIQRASLNPSSAASTVGFGQQEQALAVLESSRRIDVIRSSKNEKYFL